MGQAFETTNAAFDGLFRALQAFNLPQDIRDAIVTLVAHNAHAISSPPKRREPKTFAELATTIRKLSLKRGEVIGHDFVHDPVWHMLLAMFADQEADRPVSVSSLCQASGSAPTTALRYVASLEGAGLLARRSDPSDLRRSLLSMPDDACERMRGLLLALCVAPPAGSDHTGSVASEMDSSRLVQ